jgi:hypothetical protein
MGAPWVLFSFGQTLAWVASNDNYNLDCILRESLVIARARMRDPHDFDSPRDAAIVSIFSSRKK